MRPHVYQAISDTPKPDRDVIDIIDRINAMSDDDRRSALCWLSGYEPESLVRALDTIDAQTSRRAQRLAGGE